jgi:hypothetical protein
MIRHNWPEILKNYDATNETVLAYCRRIGVPKSGFYARRADAACEQVTSLNPTFIEIKAAPNSPIEVLTPLGLIRVQAGFDDDTFASVLRIMTGGGYVAK